VDQVRLALHPAFSVLLARDGYFKYSMLGNTYVLSTSLANHELHQFFEFFSTPRNAAETEVFLESRGDAKARQFLEFFVSQGFLVRSGDENSLEGGQEDALAILLRPWLGQATTSGQVSGELKKREIFIFGPTSFAEVLGKRLRDAGLRAQCRTRLETIFDEPIPEDSMIFALGANSDRSKLLEINRILRSKRRSWIPVVADVFGGRIGPWIDYSGGACYACLDLRQQEHSPDADLLCQSNDISRILLDSMADQAFYYYLRGLVGSGDPLRREKIFHFDFLNGRSESHSVLPHPACQVCEGVTA